MGRIITAQAFFMMMEKNTSWPKIFIPIIGSNTHLHTNNWVEYPNLNANQQNKIGCVNAVIDFNSNQCPFQT